MKDYTPYVYIIKNITTKMKYIGVRYAKGCHPDDFWTTYFTSSKLVHKLIDQFGKEDFRVKVIHKFPNDPETAILKEAFYFKYIKKRDDYLNITYSSGCQDLRISSKAGKVGGAIVKAKGIGIFRDQNERLEWAKIGGKAGAASQIKNKIGIHGQTDEERLAFAKKGNEKCKELGKGFFDSEVQRKLGKIGGPKNKGFKWYNDGERDYKYTSKEQQNMSFDEFILNSKFNKGRTKLNQNSN